MKCNNCKYFEPFNGVCCNADSEHCADMPWQFGFEGCEKGGNKMREVTEKEFREFVKSNNAKPSVNAMFNTVEYSDKNGNVIAITDLDHNGNHKYKIGKIEFTCDTGVILMGR